MSDDDAQADDDIRRKRDKHDAAIRQMLDAAVPRASEREDVEQPEGQSA